MTREELLELTPAHDFEMSGLLLSDRGMTKDFDGYKLVNDTVYRCRWYPQSNQWLIEPKYGKKRLKVTPKILRITKKS